jgi:squalene-associated FAD-dependent desaturase
MPSVFVLGGGLAGMAAAAALARSGHDVTLLEARPFLGGRATSYPLPPSGGESDSIDNCQHILLGCCRNLMDFYRRLGVEGKIRFHREYHFLEPGGRHSLLRPGWLPAPLHFSGSFLRLPFLGLSDKLSLARGLQALASEYGRRADLDSLTMLEWLKEKRQTPVAIDRFWRQILVSAVNEDLDVVSARHGFQVLRLGFLQSAEDARLGIPAVPLAELYDFSLLASQTRLRVIARAKVDAVEMDGGTGASVRSVRAGGEEFRADAYVCSLPFEKTAELLPALPVRWDRFRHSPITGIHLWFERRVTELPYAALLDRNIQWFFNKDGGRYLQVVVSASRGLLPMSREEVISLALKELGEFLPAVGATPLLKAHVVKEVRATFSAVAGLEAERPLPPTPAPNLFLAGDWTRSGWPATMEGAVRSGYLAAEAVARHFGNPASFLIPDPGPAL